MALNIRKSLDQMMYGLVAAHNANQQYFASVTSLSHSDVTSVTSGDYQTPVATALSVPGAATSVLADVITKANLAKAYYNVHIVDGQAHKAADTVSHQVTAADATDQGTANTLLNSIKAKYNVHRTQAGVHYTNDSTNVVTAATATDLASSKALVDDIQAQFNAHIISAPTSPMINLISA